MLPGRRADGASLAHLISTEAVTIAVGVPTAWLGLLEYLEATGGNVPSLERIVIVGRAKDLIKSGGEWINPAEIETIVGAHPEVSLAAVIGRSNPKWGERPMLLVELRGRDDVSDEALLAPLQGRVAA